MKLSNRMVTCARCGRSRRHFARELCRSCYESASLSGQLIEFERSARSADEVLSEWDQLRQEGHTVRTAAPRLGMSVAALDQALCRGRRRGDPRALRPGEVRTAYPSAQPEELAS